MERKPKVRIARLYQKRSANGSTWFVGRMGAARLLLLRDSERADDGGPIWNLLVEEADAQPREERAAAADAKREGQGARRRQPARPRSAPAVPPGSGQPLTSDRLDDLWQGG